MNLNENIKQRRTIWPTRLTSVMEIQRQRYSQLNNKFKQRPVINLSQSSKIQPIILPQASRPQPRQQPRSKPQIHLPPTRRSTTANIHNQKPALSSLISPNENYITLANLSKVLHVLQINEKTGGRSDGETDTSTSTSTSTKQRVQQHLQETATRWWRPIRSSDSQAVSSSVHTSGVSTVMQQYPDENIPLLTIVSNSTYQLNTSSKTHRGDEHSRNDESEVSTEIHTSNVLSSTVSPVKILSLPRTRQEPLIMQARGMHLHSYDHRYFNNNMNFFQQQRLIRQT